MPGVIIPYTFIVECIELVKENWSLGSPISPQIDLTDISVVDTSPMEASTPSHLSSLSEMEATQYYAGIPSSPRLLARTSSSPWKQRKGPGVYRRIKQLGTVTGHRLNNVTVWEKNVAPRVHACLDELGIEWTSTDVVRIGEVGVYPAPVILWIGVKPKSLGGEGAHTAAFKCRDILHEQGITDVDVELRESSVIRSAGPKLLPPVLTANPTVAARHPLTHALGLAISPLAVPTSGGTGGFFMAAGRGSQKLLLITARHVVFPPSMVPNSLFVRKDSSQPRVDVLLLGEHTYDGCLEDIMTRIGEHAMTIEDSNWRIKNVKGRDDEDAITELEAAQYEITKAGKAMDALYKFHGDVKKDWDISTNRVLGHVVYSPPIRLSAGTADEQFTEDYAVIEVDDDKIDRSTFAGNVLDLGTTVPIWEFKKMYPHVQNPISFNYPADRLLKLRGTISDAEMRCPTTLYENRETCLMVIKDGSTTGVTIGRANGIMSFVREYSNNNCHQESKEWAILPYDHKSGPFSARGDSGAVVVDGQGRIGGIITGGSGITSSTDISYVTPIGFLLKSIKANFPDAHLNPV